MCIRDRLQKVDALEGAGGNRYDFRDKLVFPEQVHGFEQRGFGHQVDLIDNQEMCIRDSIRSGP